MPRCSHLALLADVNGLGEPMPDLGESLQACVVCFGSGLLTNLAVMYSSLFCPRQLPMISMRSWKSSHSRVPFRFTSKHCSIQVNKQTEEREESVFPFVKKEGVDVGEGFVQVDDILVAWLSTVGHFRRHPSLYFLSSET